MEGACVVFTDGSYIQDVGAGAAIAMKQHTARCANGPVKGISNYEMETMAFMLALTKFKQLIDTDSNAFKSLAIFSDSQAALDLISRPLHPTTLQYLARYVIRTQNMIPPHYQIRLYWTPGHEGVQLKEEADKEAKMAAEGNTDPVMLPFSLGSLLRHTKEVFKKKGSGPHPPLPIKGPLDS